ncbi:NAD(P)-dependent oxidoreductase [Ornithinimicrobium sediminis]|uniref:NAD(P)-dependent oxidoreductase n=1 Tax=Ornithinimicrobium sediminis TaxID=2904603 RepID=UPI001E2B4C36|nr:NAD(P)-binding domain-containing protein [Ornithinimicrobium sediminis]MCE0487968.1 NAD(P)-binding domain-containing protein [Ornithinimicrobium sediminis]
MSTIGYLGLGIMGSPMAVNLQRAGHTVRGWNRSPGKADALFAAGGTEAGSIAEAVAGAQVVCVNVSDTPDVVQVLTGEEGAFAHCAPGTVVVDFSTIRPDVTRDLAAQAAERGLSLLDAPVSGGEQGAVDGVLSVMVGGDQEAFDDSAEVFAAVGRTVLRVGPSGAGQTVKAANQLVVAGYVEVLAEAVVLLESQGVDLEVALDVLAGGMAGSRVLEQKRSLMTGREFRPGFRVDLHHKDMGIVLDTARDAGVVMPVAALTAQLLASARANGDGDLDHSALLRGVLRLSGRDLGTA